MKIFFVYKSLQADKSILKMANKDVWVMKNLFLNCNECNGNPAFTACL